MALFGPPNVEKMQAKRDVRGLTRVLTYRVDATERAAAAAALGEIGDACAVQPLIATLGWQETFAHER